MKNVKRYLSIFMVIAMIIAMTAACGSKEKEAAEPDQAETEAEVTDVESEPEAGSEDVQAEAPAEMTEEQKAAQAEKEAMIKAAEERGVVFSDEYDAAIPMGIPDDILQQLYDSVKTSVTEEYLKKYGIAPEGFQWPEDDAGWRYLQDLIEQKLKLIKDGIFDEPIPQPEKFEADSQTAELMEVVYIQIISWIQTNNLDLLQMYSTSWSDVIRSNITF